MSPTPSSALEAPVLEDPSELTAAWLESVLREAGLDVRIRDLRSEPIGTGQMAHSERIHVEYASAPDDAPRSFAAKFASPDPTSRGAGAAGAYRAEVRFYTDLAAGLSIRVPRCFHGSISDDDTLFTLILEDLAPARQGDQIEGASDEQIEAAVVNLAGLHAPRWNDPALRELDWIPTGASDVLATFLQAATPGFLERYRDRVAPEDAEILRGTAERIARWVETQPADETLVHGDYRLDNLLFGGPEGGAPVAAVDWQTLSVGSAGRDLAYLLGNSSAPERRRAHEDRMLAAYRRAMAALGTPLDAERLRHAYRHGSLQGPLITVLGAIAVGRTERGDAMFMAMTRRCAAQIRDLDALALLDASS